MKKVFNEQEILAWEDRFRANFFNTASGAKSLALVGTRSNEGVANLGLFFSVTHIGAHPPLVGLLFRPHTVARHTLENIEASGYYTINTVQRSFLTKAHQAAAKYAAEVNEFKEVGLTEEYLPSFEAPFVKESKLKLGMEFCEKHLIRINQTQLLIGKVRTAFVDEIAFDEQGRLDHASAETIAANGLDSYFQVSDVASYSYPRPGKDLEKLK